MDSDRICSGFACLAAIALAFCGQAALAQSHYEKIDEFIVATDFNRNFNKQAKIYFKTIGNQHGAMKDLVGSRISLSDPAGAEYELHIRTEKKTNYAIRNDERTPSDSYVFFAICRMKPSDIHEDCRHMQFYSFDSRSIFDFLFAGRVELALFGKAFDLWLERVQER